MILVGEPFLGIPWLSDGGVTLAQKTSQSLLGSRKTSQSLPGGSATHSGKVKKKFLGAFGAIFSPFCVLPPPPEGGVWRKKPVSHSEKTSQSPPPRGRVAKR